MESGIKEWLCRDLALFEDLKRAAERQFERIQAADTEGFQDASTHREDIQARITALEERIGRTVIRGAKSSEDPAVQGIRDRIRTIVLEIQETDRRSMSAAEEIKDLASREMNQLKKGKTGVRGYGMKGPRPPKFVDQQG